MADGQKSIGNFWCREAEESKRKKRIERNMFASQTVGQVYGTCRPASSSDVTSCASGHPASLLDSCPTAITKSMLVKKKERERKRQRKRRRERGEREVRERKHLRCHDPSYDQPSMVP